MFALSLVVTLLGHKTSLITMDFELDKNELKSKRYNLLTEVLNWISFLLLFIGIIVFIVFLSNNLNHVRI